MSARLLAVALVSAYGCDAQTIVVNLYPPVGDAAVSARDAAGARYAWDARVPPCFAALGRVELRDGRWCAGVLVAEQRVLTTAGCVLDPSGSDYVPTGDISFRVHGASASVPADRVVHGRDAQDDRAGGDWAAIRLARPVTTTRGAITPMTVGADDEGAGAWTVVSYVDPAGRELGVAEGCALRRYGGDSLERDCAFEAARSGGAVVVCEGDHATLRALDVRLDDPRERARYNAVPLTWFARAPLSPASLVAGPSRSYGPIVYVRDRDLGRLHVRAHEGAGWRAWAAMEPEETGADLFAAASRPELDLPYLIGANRDGSWVYLWSETDKALRFGGRSTRAPIAGADRIVAVGAAGKTDERLQLFAADASGVVYTAYQVDARPYSGFAEWYTLGRVPGATHVAVTSFEEPAPFRTRVVFVATPTGVYHDWSSGYPLEAWGDRAMGFPLVAGTAPEGSVALTAGVLRSGELYVLRANAAGELRQSLQLADHSRWLPETSFAPPLPGGVKSLAAARLRDGRNVIIAVARGGVGGISEDEIFALEEGEAPHFEGARWRRQYR
jgi:hypothetical protein